MKQNSTEMLNEMLSIIDTQIDHLKTIKALQLPQLNYRPNESSWSILECLEHLNLYGDFYLPEMEKRILNSGILVASKVYRSGWLGKYFTELMRVDNKNIKKMTSPKNKNPMHSDLNESVINRFEKQLERFKHIIELSKKTDLNRTKCAISISKFIKLRLGDTIRFNVYHIDRHMRQALKLTQ